MTASSITEKKVAPTRSLWLEGLITIITMGGYLCVWFAMAARDCKRITGRHFTPFLWFFVPIVTIVIPFASHILLSTFSKIEKEHGLPVWRVMHNLVWNLLFTGAFWSVYLVRIVTEQPRLQLVLWVIILALFLTLHHRLNRIRAAFYGEPVMHRFFGFNALEWVTGLLFLGVWGLMIWALNEVEFFGRDGEEVEAGSVIVVPDAGVSFTLTQEGWETVEKGTVTDGSSVYELRGPLMLNTMWYAVFSYGQDDDIDVLLKNRQTTFMSNMPDSTCSAQKSLQENTLLLKATVICENNQSGNEQLYMAHMIEQEEGIAEILGYMITQPKEYQELRESFISDAQGLTADVE